MNESKVYINVPHRPWSESEIKEISALIKTYVTLNPEATQTQINEGINILSEMYDAALKLRYGVT